MTPEQMRQMFEAFADPAFSKGYGEFLGIMQQQGLEAARKFWGETRVNSAFPPADEMLEHMQELYAAMGFVPLARYQALQAERDKLKTENKALRDTIAALQQNLAGENAAKAQQAWQEIVDKQLEMSREVSKSFFDALQPQTLADRPSRKKK